MAARPLLKWAGGKSQLLSQLLPLIDRPGQYRTYYEPFVGGGAVFFALAARNKMQAAWLNDLNAELMNVYRTVAFDPEWLLKALEELLEEYPISEDDYYAVRELEPTTDDDCAARTIYLNKTAFNGLYRVNKDGKFNAPYGRWPADKLPTVIDEPNIRAVHAVLDGLQARTTSLDFEAAVMAAGAGDLVYIDPPYLPVKADSFGKGYTSSGFSMEDHERLARVFGELVDRGVAVVASNSDTPAARELYKGFQIIEVEARRSINSKGDGRGPVGELIIVGQRI